jgi:hypothetical protein
LAQHWKLITFMSGGTELEDKPLESTTWFGLYVDKLY